MLFLTVHFCAGKQLSLSLCAPLLFFVCFFVGVLLPRFADEKYLASTISGVWAQTNAQKMEACTSGLTLL